MTSLIVKDFYADWCPPCKLQTPIIDELEQEFKKVEFKKINVDNEREEAREYGIRSIPTIIIETREGVVKKLVGLQNKENLKKLLKELLEEIE